MKKRKIIGFSFILLGILIALYWPNRWKYIVIHHSAGDYGNIEHLQKIHDQRQSKDPIHAIAYHYIIGNGKGMEDGTVASDMRKQFNLWGIHVSRNNRDRNARGLGICIIGNIDQHQMTAKQYKSLIELTKTLMNRYGIEAKNVGFHGKIPGESTRCPGRYFPYESFRKEIGIQK